MLAPYWDDQVTFCTGCGIFTTTTGTAPNRVFYVEYRTEDFGDSVPLNYEIALYENGSPPFQYIYNTITADPFGNDSALVVGVKQDNVIFTQYGCDDTGGINPPVSSGQQLTASFVPCGGPSPTPTPTPTASPIPCNAYTTTTGTGTIVAGTTDTGNHCDDCTTAVTAPFPISFYGTTYNSVNVGSNGSLNLTGTTSPFTHGCLTLPSSSFGAAILLYQDDLETVTGLPGCSTWTNGCGVFTTVSGTAPNRTFYLEWHAVHFANTATTADFEVAFYENTPSFFDVFYGVTSDTGSDETSGVQASATGPATTFSCGTPTLTNGLKVTYTCSAGATPTATATATSTPTATATATATTTATATATGSVPPTPTATATATQRHADTDADLPCRCLRVHHRQRHIRARHDQHRHQLRRLWCRHLPAIPCHVVRPDLHVSDRWV